MDFYFPDSQDQINPNFDLLSEERSPFHVRQRDDLYAHEVHKKPPYTGILVSKAIVDGLGSAGRYTAAQRHRLYRLGIRGFFRLDEVSGPRLKTLGDCGAFSYAADPEPRYSADEVIDFYDGCGFDQGIALDHVIFGYRADCDLDGDVPHEWVERHELNFRLAEKFLDRYRARGCTFEPVGVAHGYSPQSYADSVARLQDLGYARIALGGMVPLKTLQIIACLERISDVRASDTEFHLLGVTRTESVSSFNSYGVTSFDSTSPFRQAFKDEKNNYYWKGRTYTAIRVPQVEGNAKLQARIRAGLIDQGEARVCERAALDAVRGYDRGEVPILEALAALRAYDALQGRKDLTESYRATLEDRAWKQCSCGVCVSAGVEVMLFRGTERNKRRGFHNIFVFNQRLQRHLKPPRRRATSSSSS
jgi:hypothetical protein